VQRPSSQLAAFRGPHLYWHDQPDLSKSSASLEYSEHTYCTSSRLTAAPQPKGHAVSIRTQSEERVQRWLSNRTYWNWFWRTHLERRCAPTSSECASVSHRSQEGTWNVLFAGGLSEAGTGGGVLVKDEQEQRRSAAAEQRSTRTPFANGREGKACVRMRCIRDCRVGMSTKEGHAKAAQAWLVNNHPSPVRPTYQVSAAPPER